MNDATDPMYISDAQQRILGLILVLAGHEIDGLANGQIAQANKCSPSQVTRDLANLAHMGWAEQIPGTGRWRLGPEIVQVSLRHMAALDRATRRLDEIRGRFSREGVMDDLLAQAQEEAAMRRSLLEVARQFYMLLQLSETLPIAAHRLVSNAGGKHRDAQELLIAMRDALLSGITQMLLLIELDRRETNFIKRKP